MLRRDYAARVKWSSWRNHMTSRFERPHIWSTILRLGNATRLMLSSAQYVAPAASRVRIEAAGKDLGERPVWDDDADAIYHTAIATPPHNWAARFLNRKALPWPLSGE